MAGSKGKGSVCEMLASALLGCGCSVGLYTSPHMVDVRERIRVNGAMISREAFAALASRALAGAERIAPEHGEATFFELTTAMALAHFAEQAVDVAVVEVGMGGLLDATNVVRPAVCVLTSIQREHVEYLGPALADIAQHKAGILKPGAFAITHAQDDAVLSVFRAAAQRAGVVLEVVGGTPPPDGVDAGSQRAIDFSYRFEAASHRSGAGGGGAGGSGGAQFWVSLTTPTSSFEHVACVLPGEHQVWNLGLVLAVLDKLRQGMPPMLAPLDLPEAGILAGLARTPRHGRLERVMLDPKIVVDGAHNPPSVAATLRALPQTLRYDSLVVVFGCAADKDVRGMMEALAGGADKVIFTKAEGNARSADPRDLARAYSDASGRGASVASSVREAMNIAARAMAKGDAMLVTGSFAVAGEAKRLLEAKYATASTAEGKPAGHATGAGRDAPRSGEA